MTIGAIGNYSYAYDAYGRLNHVNDITYSRLANSNLPGTVTRPNNVNTTWSYETNRNLVTAVANGTLSTYSYVNDALGRRQSMAKSGSLFNPSETLSYAYNDRSEVTGASSDVNSNYSYFYARGSIILSQFVYRHGDYNDDNFGKGEAYKCANGSIYNHAAPHLSAREGCPGRSPGSYIDAPGGLGKKVFTFRVIAYCRCKCENDREIDRLEFTFHSTSGAISEQVDK